MHVSWSDMILRICRLTVVGCLLGLTLAGCRSPEGEAAATQTSESSSLLDRAEAEATALVQRARATAIVLEAQARATALLRAQSAPMQQAPAGPTRIALAGDDVSEAAPARTSQPGVGGAPDARQPTPVEVEILRVGLAADGGLIIVRFRAPVREAETWWQGSASVLNEKTGTLHAEIPNLPRIGPLISKPVREGGTGYVMVVNQPPRLALGDRVTVTLGRHRFESLLVE